MTLALPLLLALITRVELVPSQTIQVPSHDWGQFAIDLRQRPALVDAAFAVESGPERMRMALLRRDDADRLRNGEPHGVLAETEAAHAGAFHFQVRDPGEYVMVLDNRLDGDRAATVRVNVWIDYADPLVPGVRELTPRRRLIVVLISCAVFLAVAGVSARQLWRAGRARYDRSGANAGASPDAAD